MPFDWFIDTVPEVIERVEQAGLQSKLETLRWTIVQSVRLRFPALIDFAQVQVDKLATKTQLERFTTLEATLAQILARLPEPPE